MNIEPAAPEAAGKLAESVPVVQPAGLGTPAPLTGGLNAASVLALQRTSGNQAVARFLARQPEGLISTAELATRWRGAREAQPLNPRRPGIVFRLPDAASIKAMLASGDVPEAKIKDSVATALQRMKAEGKLKSKKKIPALITRLFPAPATFDEAEFAKVIDVADRSQIYKKASDAEAKLTPADKLKVIAAMDKADTLIDQAIADATGLTQVFGTKASIAKANYGKAKTALASLKGNIDTNIHTDYNLDDEQVGLGGWANFASKMVHLSPTIAAGKDPDEAAITILHECAHLADPTVQDKGYYPPDAKNSAGWDAMSEDEKVTNAAHYEEIPRRKQKTSVYKKPKQQTFTPGVSASSGGAVTFKTKVRRLSSEYLREAWDAAVDVQLGLRRVRVDIEAGNTTLFKAKQARIIEVSKLEKLSIHEQKPTPKTVSTLDLSLAEGVARATNVISNFADKQTVPTKPAKGKSEQDYADEIVVKATAKYGALTGSAADDKTLLDWLVAHVGKTGLL